MAATMRPPEARRPHCPLCAIAVPYARRREPWPAGGALTRLFARGLAQRPDERPAAAMRAGEFACGDE
jgi:hypothetical protein